MRLFGRTKDTKSSAARARTVTAAGDAELTTPMVNELATKVPVPLPSYDHLEDSDVFLKPNAPATTPPAPSTEVTLFVYGWQSVEPGTLSWVFPSLRAALDSVQRMKNAIAWSIVQGSDWDDLELARDHGA